MVSSKIAFCYCSLLALQFGLQPLVSSRYTPTGVNYKTIVIGTELIKVLISIVIISFESKEAKQNIIKKFTLMNSLKRAALPASLYSIQNLFVQYGLQLMDNMTFNLLNQTKTLSAAFFLYIFLGKKQSFIQIIALFLLLGAGIIYIYIYILSLYYFILKLFFSLFL
jgi:UDP-sugar transporter A1/2/3